MLIQRIRILAATFFSRNPPAFVLLSLASLASQKFVLSENKKTPAAVLLAGVSAESCFYQPPRCSNWEINKAWGIIYSESCYTNGPIFCYRRGLLQAPFPQSWWPRRKFGTPENGPVQKEMVFHNQQNPWLQLPPTPVFVEGRGG